MVPTPTMTLPLGFAHTASVRSIRPSGLAIALLSVLTAVAAPRAHGQVPDSAAERGTPNVLLLFAENKNQPPIQLAERTIATALGAPEGTVNLFAEFMDLPRFPESEDQLALRDFYARKYGRRGVDVIVAAMAPTLRFLLQHGPEVFPGVPIVFTGLDRRELDEMALSPNVTGVLTKREFAPTLELALSLQPGTEEVFFISGADEFSQYWMRQARRELAPLSERVSINYLSGLSTEDLQDTVEHLPDRSIILFSYFFRDGAGRALGPYQSLSVVVQHASAPVYVIADAYLGHGAESVGYGAVGGVLISVEELARQAGRLASRILEGTPADSIPMVETSATNVPMFDWRALRRWRIPEDRLPPGSIVRYRSTSFWREALPYAVGGLAFLLLQATLIAVLLLHRARLRRTEADLRDSQERMNLAAAAASLGFWEWHLSRDEIWISPGGRALFGLDGSEQIDVEHFHRIVVAEDREPVRRKVEQAQTKAGEFDIEYRVERDDGVRWISTWGRVETGESGTPVRMRGVSLDVTEAKQVEAELQRQRAELAHVARVASLGQLSTALAHELNQPLTAILSNAQTAQRFLAAGTSDLETLREILDDIVEDDVRAGAIISGIRAFVGREEMAHEPLEVAQLLRAVVGYVGNEAMLQHVALLLELDTPLPPVLGDRIQLQQVMLNLMLNALDAMRNAPEEAREVRVTAREREGLIQVSVRDRGVGLDPDTLEKVFQPFYTTKPDGLGVGLSICRTIIQNHEGFLWAENNPDGGATFHFALPPADRQTKPADPREAGLDDRGRP